MAQQRLQKIIAQAGVTSRRKAEQLIVDGRVAVNGVVVTELGAAADPDADLVTLDGTTLRQERVRHFIAHKPPSVLCAVSDERGRPVIVDLLDRSVGERLYPAGRLDLESEGLVLLTNDGELMYPVTRAGGEVGKTYFVTVRGRPEESRLAELRAGIEMDGTTTLPCRIDLLETTEHAPGRSTTLRVVLHEGKKNQIRRMFKGIGHAVIRLVRTSIGPLHLDGLAAGAVRELAAEEVDALRQLANRAPTRGTDGLH